MKKNQLKNITVTISIFFTILLINFPIDLYAQEDTTPPELVEFNFTPKSIDVSTDPAEVKATIRVTDDLSGVSSVGGDIYQSNRATQCCGVFTRSYFG
jgi:hypothetical protein